MRIFILYCSSRKLIVKNFHWWCEMTKFNVSFCLSKHQPNLYFPVLWKYCIYCKYCIQLKKGSLALGMVHTYWPCVFSRIILSYLLAFMQLTWKMDNGSGLWMGFSSKMTLLGQCRLGWMVKVTTESKLKNSHTANSGSNIRSLLLIYSPLMPPFHQPFIYIACKNIQEKQTSWHYQCSSKHV